jgi:hypothetical protein
MREVERIYAEKEIAFGLRYRGPYGRERNDLDHLNMVDAVQVYRQAAHHWDGPFRFVELYLDTGTVELPHGRKIFCSTVLHRFQARGKRETQGVVHELDL